MLLPCAATSNTHRGGLSASSAAYAPRQSRGRDGILGFVELRVSNARVEAVSDKIEMAIRWDCGYRNIGDLIVLVMLRRSDPRSVLPGASRLLRMACTARKSIEGGSHERRFHDSAGLRLDRASRRRHDGAGASDRQADPREEGAVAHGRDRRHGCTGPKGRRRPPLVRACTLRGGRSDVRVPRNCEVRKRAYRDRARAHGPTQAREDRLACGRQGAGGVPAERPIKGDSHGQHWIDERVRRSWCGVAPCCPRGAAITLQEILFAFEQACGEVRCEAKAAPAHNTLDRESSHPV